MKINQFKIHQMMFEILSDFEPLYYNVPLKYHEKWKEEMLELSESFAQQVFEQYEKYKKL